VVKDERAAAAGLFFQAPYPARQRHFPLRLALTGAHMHAQDLRFTNLSRFQQPLRFNMRWIKDKILVDPQHQTGLVGFRDHFVCFRQVERHGFLHGYMLAGTQRLQRHTAVQMVRYQQFHQVNIRLFEQFAEVLVYPVDSPLPGFGFRARFIAITQSNQAGIFPALVPHIMQIRDPATTDKRHVDLFHYATSLA